MKVLCGEPDFPPIQWSLPLIRLFGRPTSWYSRRSLPRRRSFNRLSIPCISTGSSDDRSSGGADDRFDTHSLSNEFFEPSGDFLRTFGLAFSGCHLSGKAPGHLHPVLQSLSQGGRVVAGCRHTPSGRTNPLASTCRSPESVGYVTSFSMAEVFVRISGEKRKAGMLETRLPLQEEKTEELVS